MSKKGDFLLSALDALVMGFDIYDCCWVSEVLQKESEQKVVSAVQLVQYTEKIFCEVAADKDGVDVRDFKEPGELMQIANLLVDNKKLKAECLSLAGLPADLAPDGVRAAVRLLVAIAGELLSTWFTFDLNKQVGGGVRQPMLAALGSAVIADFRSLFGHIARVPALASLVLYAGPRLFDAIYPLLLIWGLGVAAAASKDHMRDIGEQHLLPLLRAMVALSKAAAHANWSMLCKAKQLLERVKRQCATALAGLESAVDTHALPLQEEADAEAGVNGSVAGDGSDNAGSEQGAGDGSDNAGSDKVRRVRA
jgi:hypothetical protein